MQDGAKTADDLGASKGGIGRGGGIAGESEEGAKGWQRVSVEEVAQ
jgi:hypothetical protein